MPYDPLSVGCPSKDFIFNEVLDDGLAHPTPYELDQPSECHILNSAIVHAATVAYPKLPSTPRSPFVTPYIAANIVYRNSLLKLHNRTVRRISRAALYFVFQFWAKHYNRCLFTFMRGFVFYNDVRAVLKIDADLRFANSFVAMLVECSKMERVESLAEATDARISDGTISQSHHFVKALARKPPKVHKMTRILDADGVPSIDPMSEKVIVRDHFAKHLGGSVVSFESLIIKEQTKPVALIDFSGITTDQILALIPTLFGLSSVFFRSPPLLMELAKIQFLVLF